MSLKIKTLVSLQYSIVHMAIWSTFIELPDIVQVVEQSQRKVSGLPIGV
jgi:hypothetical protein